jgi:drug/metabolite transporter (DMT)-like permease
MTKYRIYGMLYLCTTVLLWCSWHIVGRALVKQLSPLTILALRCVFACPVLFATAWLIDPIGIRTVPKSLFSRLFALGVLLIGGNSFLFILGLKWTSASEAALTQPLITVFTTLLPMIFSHYGHSMTQYEYKGHTKLQKVGIVCCVLGAIWILMSKAQIPTQLQLQSSANFEVHRMLGFICLIGNTLSFSVYIWLQSSILSQLSPTVATAYSHVLATPLVVVASLVSGGGEGAKEWMTIDRSQLLGLLYVGVFATGVAGVLYSYANKWLHPTVCGLSAALQPLVTCILSVIFLRERLSFQQVIAAASIIGGVVLVLLPGNPDDTSSSEKELSLTKTHTSFSLQKNSSWMRVFTTCILIGLVGFSIYTISSNACNMSQDRKQLTAEIQRLQNSLLQLVKKQQAYRAQLGEVSCALHGVGPTGGFCRQPGRSSDGGHHLDRQLCLELTHLFAGSTVYDLGAGMGQYTQCLREVAAIDSLAYDGAENIEHATNGTVRFMDLSEPQPWEVLGVRDWVLSLEVAEHIPAAFESTYLFNIDHANRKGIVISWAIRNQTGYHHVNCRNNSEVISLFASMGYRYDRQQSSKLRSLVNLWWFRQTIMVFVHIPVQ